MIIGVVAILLTRMRIKVGATHVCRNITTIYMLYTGSVPLIHPTRHTRMRVAILERQPAKSRYVWMTNRALRGGEPTATTLCLTKLVVVDVWRWRTCVYGGRVSHTLARSRLHCHQHHLGAIYPPASHITRVRAERRHIYLCIQIYQRSGWVTVDGWCTCVCVCVFFVHVLRTTDIWCARTGPRIVQKANPLAESNNLDYSGRGSMRRQPERNDSLTESAFLTKRKKSLRLAKNML